MSIEMKTLTIDDVLYEVVDEVARNGNIQIVTATSTDGATYTATVPNMDALEVGREIVLIPDYTSTVVNPKLNVNGLGDKYLRCPIGINNVTTTTGASESWIYSGKPVSARYNGTFWVTDVYRADANNLYGTVPIEKGGTSASTAETARANLDVYSKEEVTTAIFTAVFDKIILKDQSTGTNYNLYVSDGKLTLAVESEV